jgi:putative FmdB family regulatory protein
MPIYDYHCSHCGQTTEVIHGIDASGPRFCPVCGAEGTLRKAFVAPTVHFKGSGWAKKDRSSASGARARAGSSSSTNDSSDAPAKTDETASKPAASGTSGASDSTTTGKSAGSSSSGED